MTTYGWAMMAILLAIGALSYFDFLDADRYTSSTCNTGNQVQCIQSIINDSSNNLRLYIRNNYPVPIHIHSISVKETSESNYHTFTYNTPDEGDILRGSAKDMVLSLYGLGISYKPNQKKTLDLKIEFSRVGAGSIKYTIVGTTVVKVLAN